MLILDARVRSQDRVGNDAADEAADFGLRRVDHAFIVAGRNLSAVCGRWYPVVMDLHRFFIAISRTVVNHDGTDGTAPGPLVWSVGAPSAIWGSGWFNVLHLLSVLMMLLIGPTLLAFWLSGWLSWALKTGLLGLVVFLMLKCSFFMSFGLVKG